MSTLVSLPAVDSSTSTTSECMFISKNAPTARYSQALHTQLFKLCFSAQVQIQCVKGP